MRMIRRALPSLAAVLVLAGCITRAPGIGETIAWNELPGWNDERPAEAWPQLLLTCERMAPREVHWRRLCSDAALFPNPDDAIARAFFETRFAPHVLRTAEGETGLVTGYYEPLLEGRREKSVRFRYPIYGAPADLVTVELGALYPELNGRRLRGRLVGKRVLPYPNRAEIEAPSTTLPAPVLAWVDDPVALFFLHIQGSGRVRFPDGTTLRVGYVDQNGHPYVAIGRTLVERGALAPDAVDMPAIRAWLAANPDQAASVLQSNPSYIFFAPRDATLPGPLGALEVPLLAERAAAVDPKHVPLGSPLWVDTKLPQDVATYRRLLFALDTGGAIKGPVRVDIFFGYGKEAEDRAGRMKQPGRVYALLPAPR